MEILLGRAEVVCGLAIATLDIMVAWDKNKATSEAK